MPNRSSGNANKVEVVWEDPPPPPNKPTMYAEALEEVKKNPGQWARIRVFDGQSSAYSARKMILKQLDGARGWEIQAAKTEDGKAAIYVKYQSLTPVS